MEKQQTDSKGGAPKKIKVNPTPEELADLKLAAMKLWSLDIHRFVPGKDYKINLQHSKTIYNKEDVASDPLFVGVDRNKFMSVPTYKTFYDLLDNYEHEIGVAEVVTQEEIEENWRFLNAVCATPCMMYAYEYLHAKKRIPAGMEAFKKQLYDLWFNMYRRGKGRGDDSSGFEHVFVGELKDGNTVIGLHNWIQIFLEEKKGRLDYQGYVSPKKKGHTDSVPSETEQLITIQFTWDVKEKMDKRKDVSSTFVGTSPEFELALYSLCFLVDHEEDHFIEVGSPGHIHMVNIKCHRWRVGDKERIASVFPVAIED